MDRRQLLITGAGVAGLAAVGLPGVAHADQGLAEGVVVTDLGPASLVTSTGVAEMVGDRLWTATSGVSPVRVGGFNFETKQVEDAVSIPTGAGVWGMASIGTDLYIGTYTPGDLYRIDTTNGAVTLVASIGYFIWSMAATPDGTIVLGTYSDAAVHEYVPATGEVRKFGNVFAGEQYVRSIAADATTIYAGIGTAAHLVTVDRSTGEHRDVLPAGYLDRTFVATLALRGSTLAAGLSATGTMLIFDTATMIDPIEVQLSDEKYVTAIEISRDGRTVWAASRPAGHVWSYDLATGQLTDHGQPYDGAYVNRLQDTEPFGLVAGLSSQVVLIDPTTSPATFTGTDLGEAGLPPAPELAMQMAATTDPAGDHVVYVSGKAGIQIHRVAGNSHTTSRVFLPGEAKTITPVDGRVMLGVYTLARIWEMAVDGSGLHELDRVEHEQTRPTDALVADGTYHLTTEPDYGHYEGSLTLRAADGSLTVWRGIIPDQSVQSVARSGGTIYLGSNIRNSLGTTPVVSSATISAVDAVTGVVRWQVTPEADAAQYRCLRWIRGRLIATDQAGRVLRLDAKGQVEEVIMVGRAGLAMTVARGQLYATDGHSVFWFPEPRTSLATKTLVTGLANNTYSGSMITAAPDGSALYTLKGRNLARIQL